MDRRLFLMSGVAAAGLTLTGERAGFAQAMEFDVALIVTWPASATTSASRPR